MTIKEKRAQWEEKRKEAILAWVKDNPEPTSDIPDSIGGFYIVERADGSGYDVCCKFVSLELLEAAVERLHERSRCIGGRSFVHGRRIRRQVGRRKIL